MSSTLDFMVFHPKEKGGAKRHPSLLDLVLDLVIEWEDSKGAIAVYGKLRGDHSMVILATSSNRLL
jgi:hypothetical protein